MVIRNWASMQQQDFAGGSGLRAPGGRAGLPVLTRREGRHVELGDRGRFIGQHLGSQRRFGRGDVDVHGRVGCGPSVCVCMLVCVRARDCEAKRHEKVL